MVNPRSLRGRSLLEFVPRPIIKTAQVIIIGYDAVLFLWEEIIKVQIVVSKKRLVKNNTMCSAWSNHMSEDLAVAAANMNNDSLNSNLDCEVD